MMLPEKDPDHWLYRLAPEEWLSAARGELLQARRALAAGQQRRGVAHARRAAGMALNAVLIVRPDESWGRSFMDHLRAVSAEESLPPRLREAAGLLLSTPLDAPRLIRFGGGGDQWVGAAGEDVLSWCRAAVEKSVPRPSR